MVCRGEDDGEPEDRTAVRRRRRGSGRWSASLPRLRRRVVALCRPARRGRPGSPVPGVGSIDTAPAVIASKAASSSGPDTARSVRFTRASRRGRRVRRRGAEDGGHPVLAVQQDGGGHDIAGTAPAATGRAGRKRPAGRVVDGGVGDADVGHEVLRGALRARRRGRRCRGTAPRSLWCGRRRVAVRAFPCGRGRTTSPRC
jgi:hypothetical protein